LESVKGNKFITTWEGSKPSKQIDKITYSDNTVWINKTQSEGFHGVPENVWDFHIGGYQVCDKWLKRPQRPGSFHGRHKPLPENCRGAQ